MQSSIRSVLKRFSVFHLLSRQEAVGLHACGRVGGLLLALTVAAAPAVAQDALLDAAQARLARQDAAAAYALLADAETVRAGDARFDYLLGVAALDAGHVTRAVFALERAVDRRPDDMLARAELGRAYLAAGDADAAREQLRIVRAAPLPDGAAAAIERVLGLIDGMAPPPARPRVTGYMDLGIGHDSNVNSATNQGEFAIPAFGGIVFQTTPENRQQDDLFALAAGGAHAEVALSPTWQGLMGAHVRAAVNRVVHDMNTVFVDAMMGLRHTDGAQSQLVALQNNTAWVGGSLYRRASGVAAQWQWQVGPTAQASVFGQWSRQDYQAQAERNTDRTLLGAGMARQFAATDTLVSGSAYAVQERAGEAAQAHFGHRGFGLRLAVEQRLSADLSGFAEWQREWRRYGGTEPFFDMPRRDQQRDIAAGLRWQIDPQWQLVAQARRGHALSNVVLYDYARTLFQVAIHRSFP